MATRKENIDIEYDEPQQEAVSGSAESNVPYESQDPAEWVPPMTVRIYPISRPRTKLLATANVNIAKSFAVQGFRIYDSKNGLFVKEPQRSYVKNGTEMTSSVWLPRHKRGPGRAVQPDPQFLRTGHGAAGAPAPPAKGRIGGAAGRRRFALYPTL